MNDYMQNWVIDSDNDILPHNLCGGGGGASTCKGDNTWHTLAAK